MGDLPGLQDGVCIGCGGPMLEKNDLHMCRLCRSKTNEKYKAFKESSNDGQRKRIKIKLPILKRI